MSEQNNGETAATPIPSETTGETEKEASLLREDELGKIAGGVSKPRPDSY